MDPSDPNLPVTTIVEMTIEQDDQGASPHRIRLGANDIDGLITRLALVRATMQPEVPRCIPAAAASVRQLLDPSWILHRRGIDESRLLMLRDPGLGWIVFRLPLPEAMSLGRALLADRPRQEEDRTLRSDRLH